VSAVLVVALAAVFGYILFQTRKQLHNSPSQTPSPAAIRTGEGP
jgi:hypothetical protein